MKYKQWYIAAALALLLLAVVCLYQRQTTSTVRSGYTQAAPSQRQAPVGAIGDGFMNIPDGVEDEGLPFN